MKFFLARHSRALASAMFCVAALLVASLCGGFNQRGKSADTIAGKWGGDIAWNAASGRDYSRTMHTALFFLPNGVAGIVITFPTGAIGGTGTYTLKDGFLIVRCSGLSVTGHAVPLSLFAKEPWFHETSTYTVAFEGATMTLTPTAGRPFSAPCYPLLTSARPLVLSRVDGPGEKEAEPAVKE